MLFCCCFSSMSLKLYSEKEENTKKKNPVSCFKGFFTKRDFLMTKYDIQRHQRVSAENKAI